MPAPGVILNNHVKRRPHLPIATDDMLKVDENGEAP